MAFDDDCIDINGDMVLRIATDEDYKSEITQAKSLTVFAFVIFVNRGGESVKDWEVEERSPCGRLSYKVGKNGELICYDEELKYHPRPNQFSPRFSKFGEMFARDYRDNILEMLKYYTNIRDDRPTPHRESNIDLNFDKVFIKEKVER